MQAINRWYITGDTHGRVSERILGMAYQKPNFYPEESAVIILGDAGLNYYGKAKDKRRKRYASEHGVMIYCVRGNHEIRPEDVEGMRLVYDDNVGGEVYMETEFPLIRYFVDGGVYSIGGNKTLVIGGAYSVDKYYRLSTSNKDMSYWFENEQLSESEMDTIMKNVSGQHFDLVLTHTAPDKFVPTDLFLPSIDQSTVDTTMEKWLDKVEEALDYGVWLFGHYHADRIEAPFVEQFFRESESLGSILRRWSAYKETGEVKGVLGLSPKMERLRGERSVE